MTTNRGRIGFEIGSILLIILFAVISLRPVVNERQTVQLDKGRLNYTGRVEKHKFAGQGTLKLDNQDQYQGAFEAGRFNGQGTFTSHAGWQLKAKFVDGEPQGKVTLRDGKQTYFGSTLTNEE
ncbi:hypothetical protein [Lactiplantibacillus modestisalitolerans]|uniref:MORN repeat protein n=1 Tax=Lactiplantibacillus modestisalitolerans TaxID=1457219 RepID=A0ABV5WRH5_9LACO|nr:hypothetical protein [Lactiplantibacillus modestisalitolerans]